MKRKLLNVGGGNKNIELPIQYDDFEHLLLDIDPAGNPDILCDARELKNLEGEQFDAIYCSHNLEHYYRHDVPKVLSGFIHVLKRGGFADIRVPDMNELMKETIRRGLDIDDVIYTAPCGPIMVLDVIYGLTPQIESSGQDFYAHKTGFTLKSLTAALERSGFNRIYGKTGNLEVAMLTFKGEPDAYAKNLFGIKD